MDSLPDELIAIIISNVTAHDLAQLCRTCKNLHRLAGSLLWKNIEFHDPSFHEVSDLKHPQPAVSASQRFYHVEPMGYHGSRKAGKLFYILRNLLNEDINRLRQLCTTVDSFCTILESKEQFWQSVPHFTNLKSLEIYGDLLSWERWDDFIKLDEYIESVRTLFDQNELTSFYSTPPPLSKLRFVKLTGIIPRDIVAWVLESGTNMERLELELFDKGMTSRSTANRKILRLSDDIYTPPDPPYGRLPGWAAIPRPLSGFLPRREDRPLILPQLKHLHLCQSSPGALSWRVLGYFWSTTAEVAAHKDWEQVLRASHQTLETLVIEQKLGLEQDDGASDNVKGFWVLDHDGIGCKRLMDVLESVFTEVEFPALKRVSLRGIVVGSRKHGQPIGNVPGGRFMRRLEKMNIPCDARVGEGFWFDGEYGIIHTYRWDCLRHDRDEDGPWEDVLAMV